MMRMEIKTVLVINNDAAIDQILAISFSAVDIRH